jgi:hypothetical protein
MTSVTVVDVAQTQQQTEPPKVDRQEVLARIVASTRGHNAALELRVESGGE